MRRGFYTTVNFTLYRVPTASPPPAPSGGKVAAALPPSPPVGSDVCSCGLQDRNPSQFHLRFSDTEDSLVFSKALVNAKAVQLKTLFPGHISIPLRLSTTATGGRLAQTIKVSFEVAQRSSSWSSISISSLTDALLGSEQAFHYAIVGPGGSKRCPVCTSNVYGERRFERLLEPPSPSLPPQAPPSPPFSADDPGEPSMPPSSPPLGPGPGGALFSCYTVVTLNDCVQALFACRFSIDRLPGFAAKNPQGCQRCSTNAAGWCGKGITVKYCCTAV